MGTPKIPEAAKLFGSVRSSSDLRLAAFAGALLLSFAAAAGAFLPPLRGEPAHRTVRAQPSRLRPAPVVAGEPCADPPRGLGFDPRAGIGGKAPGARLRILGL